MGRNRTLDKEEIEIEIELGKNLDMKCYHNKTPNFNRMEKAYRI